MMAWYVAVAKYTALAYALRATKGNRRAAARMLGVHRNLVYRLLNDVQQARVRTRW